MIDVVLSSPVKDVLLVLLGVVLTLAVTVARGRVRERSRRAQLLGAVRGALAANAAILDGIPASYGTDPIPRTVDLVVLEATVPLMVGLVPTSTRAAVERARGHLAEVQRAMLDHRQQVAANVPVNRRKVAVDNITGKLVAAARTACEDALVALNCDVKPVEPAKPAKLDGAPIAADAPTRAMP